MDDKLKSLYMDSHRELSVSVDDFLVAIGKTKSNSVYHIAEVDKRDSPKSPRMVRHHMKVYKSDLITALRREDNQYLHTIFWYSRKKKKPHIH